MDRVPLDAAHKYAGHRRSPRTARQVWEAAEEAINFDALPAVAPPGVSPATGLDAPPWLADRPPFENFAAAEIVQELRADRFLILIDPAILLHSGTLQAIPTLFALPAGQYILRIGTEHMELLTKRGADRSLCEFHPDWERGRYAFTTRT